MRNYIALFACSFAFLGFVRGVPAFNRLLSLDDDLSLPKGVALAFQDRGAEQGGINILVTRPTQTAKDLEDISRLFFDALIFVNFYLYFCNCCLTHLHF